MVRVDVGEHEKLIVIGKNVSFLDIHFQSQQFPSSWGWHHSMWPFFLESFANKRFLHRDLLVCCSFLSDGTFSDFTLKKIVLINQKEKKLKSKSINRKRQRLYKQT
jgi:hypothetical protein